MHIARTTVFASGMKWFRLLECIFCDVDHSRVLCEMLAFVSDVLSHIEDAASNKENTYVRVYCFIRFSSRMTGFRHTNVNVLLSFSDLPLLLVIVVHYVRFRSYSINIPFGVRFVMTESSRVLRSVLIDATSPFHQCGSRTTTCVYAFCSVRRSGPANNGHAKILRTR